MKDQSLRALSDCVLSLERCILALADDPRDGNRLDDLIAEMIHLSKLYFDSLWVHCVPSLSPRLTAPQWCILHRMSLAVSGKTVAEVGRYTSELIARVCSYHQVGLGQESTKTEQRVEKNTADAVKVLKEIDKNLKIGNRFEVANIA